jgi:hypothetical protein
MDKVIAVLVDSMHRRFNDSSLIPSALILSTGSPFVIFSRYSTTIGMEKLPSVGAGRRAKVESDN